MQPLHEVHTNHHITTIEPSSNHQSIPAQVSPQKTEAAEKPAPRQKPKLIPIPKDFGISERVSEWAEEKGHTQLQTHLEYFIGYVQANGKKYADWDAALMQAIRGNWAKVNTKPIAQYQPKPQSRTSLTDNSFLDSIINGGSGERDITPKKTNQIYEVGHA